MLLEKLGGHVVSTVKKKTMPSGKVEEVKAEETVGGILHWGRESGPDMNWFREAIRTAYNGRAPKVLDPFAGGGAIPLEAMRLGCEVTAIDINPVAWFVLKCTLEYPQQFAGQKLPLPDFALRDPEFMAAYFERTLDLKGASLRRRLKQHFGDEEHEGEFHALQESTTAHPVDLQADLAWQVRAWGMWVLKQARSEVAEFYPTYASWEPVLETETRKLPKAWLLGWMKDHRAEIDAKGLRLCSLKANGEVDVQKLNEEFAADYLAEPTNPRWVPKPAVAYLWARTVKNKHHPETTIPLLKTRWLCKKENKRVLLTMTPKADGSGVEFGIENDVPKVGGNTAQRREYDKRIAAGTMSRTGVTCPVHKNTLEKEDLQLEGRGASLAAVITVVVVDGQVGKEYRLPTELERARAKMASEKMGEVFANVPFGLPKERICTDAKGNTWCVMFGVDEFGKLFSERQLLALGVFLKFCRQAANDEWTSPIRSYLACVFSKLLDYENISTSLVLAKRAD